MVSVEPHLPGDHGPETAAFFQCAGMQPHRKTSLNPGVANDVMVHAASRLFNTAADLGVRSVIPVHWPLEDKDDPRAESDQWKAILDAEQMLAEQYQGSELHVFRRFATLTGNGQSPYQPPLRELWNVVARQPVYRPVDGRALGFALYDAAAELMVMTAHAEISQDFELEHDIGLGGEYLHPEALIKGLTKTVGLQPEWLDEPGGQPWGAPPREEFEVEEEIATRERFMNAVLSWATELPHFPPADWPRQMRPSRKRRKRGGKG